eukprot:6330275-Pyramimonas_sp.AAC.1
MATRLNSTRHKGRCTRDHQHVARHGLEAHGSWVSSAANAYTRGLCVFSGCHPARKRPFEVPPPCPRKSHAHPRDPGST